MKLRNVFIDCKGNIWNKESLIKSSEGLPIFNFDINSISLDEKILWQTDNLRDYCVHYKRLRECDLKIPIILRSDKYVMDGWHRIIKAKNLGINYLPARIFLINPNPDITAQY